MRYSKALVLALGLTAISTSVVFGQQSPAKPDTTKKTPLPATQSGGIKLTDRSWYCITNPCIATSDTSIVATAARKQLADARRQDSTICVDRARCQAKYDSLYKVHQEYARQDSIAKATAARRRPVSTGGTPKAAVSRGVSPTVRSQVFKNEATIKVDTLWLTKYDTVRQVVEKTVFQIDTLVIIRQDTLIINRVEFRNAKGFPVWRTLGAVALAAAGVCEAVSRDNWHENWKFKCFSRPGTTNNNSNTNINLNLIAGPGRIGLMFPISRRP